MPKNPCLECGACCCHYRVSFYWRETDDQTPCGVPLGMTVELDVHRRAMRGTDQARPRCAALLGEPAGSVRCTIYDRRPSVCREFAESLGRGVPDERCNRARARLGLPPLRPEDLTDDPQKPPEKPPECPLDGMAA